MEAVLGSLSCTDPLPGVLLGYGNREGGALLVLIMFQVIMEKIMSDTSMVHIVYTIVAS